MADTRLLLLPAVFGLILSCERPDSGHDIPEDPVTPVEFGVYNMNIQVDGNAPVVSKESGDYLTCSIKINGNGIAPDYQGTGSIRGRGNSSWFWYDKKPYRIKLDMAWSLLGMKSNRDWVLLANYRDPTDLMNAFGFEVARYLGIPFTNHTRYVELTLNGDYIGLYQLTEQVEQGGNRVNIAGEGAWLICLDLDDGPDLSPDATDNFRSSVFELPVCVKYPEEPTADQLITVKNDFAALETAINDYDYNAVSALLDIPSFINYLILEEFVYNVETDAPRSVFLYKDTDGKYVFGPAWDFDAGFDFDWGTMVTGHNYFNQQELVMGTDPSNHTNGYRISDFFTLMFRNHQFVSEYKSRWNEVKDSIFSHSWKIMEKYDAVIMDALARDFERWPIDRDYTEETARMQEWLSSRVDYLTTVINGYPDGTVPTVKVDCGEMSISDTLSFQLGYAQNVTVDIDESDLISKLGITHDLLYGPNLRIVPLKTDGTEGMNNTNGVYGGWFEEDNNPGYWANGHVYIEVFDNLTQWSCGLRAETGYCSVGEEHTVLMQYQYTTGTQTKTVTVSVTFIIAD
ncbi:MAG TPA: CotH kinase family protein [Bacteroidales bacterium]|nr:CotH kinase family protein [Bacteroidales bacterium]